MPKKPGAKAIVAHQGKILLVLRDNNPAIAYPNTWNTPGGGIEEGESPAEAMVRELKEEIHFTPSSVIYLGTTTYSDGSLVHRFYVPVSDEELPSIRLGNEGQKIGWFTLDELLQLDVSPHSLVYYIAYEQDIRKMFSGDYDFVLKHDLLDVGQRTD